MTLWTALVRTYAQSWKFLLALPILAVCVVGFEGTQHLVEWSEGMYRSQTDAAVAAHATGRMVSGVAKVSWLLILQYWIARFIVSGASTRETLTFESVSIRRFAWYFAYSLGVSLVILFLPEAVPASDVARRAVSIVVLVLMLAAMPIGVALAPWAVAAATGDSRASPRFALGRASGSILWGLAVSLLATLPLMVVHYGLGLGAIGQAPWLVALMLIVDAVCVGFLGIVINASYVVVAERMALRAGEQLTCGQAAYGAAHSR